MRRTAIYGQRGPVFLLREILGRRAPFVALVREDKLEGLVDVKELARSVATRALAEFT